MQRVKFLQLLSTKPSDKEHVGAPSNMLPLGISTKLNRGPSQSRHSKYLSPFINLCLQSVIAEPAGKARQRSFIAKQNRPRQPRSQGLSPLPPLSSTTREAEERDPGNEVVDPKYFGCEVSVRLYRLWGGGGGRGKGVPRQPDRGWRIPSFLGGKSRGACGQPRFSWREIA